MFIALAVLLIGNTIWTTPKPSALGLAMTALGGLVYVVCYRGKFRPDDPVASSPPGELPAARAASD